MRGEGSNSLVLFTLKEIKNTDEKKLKGDQELGDLNTEDGG